jgi:heat shock protein HslJ
MTLKKKDEENKEKPMINRWRIALISTGLLCLLSMMAQAGGLKGNGWVNVLTTTALTLDDKEKPKGPSVVKPKRQETERATRLVGTRWQLREISYNDGTTYKPKGKEKMTLEFGKDGRVSGKAGVNRFTGTYKADKKGAFAVGKLALTRAANPPGSIADTYVKVLRSARLYLFNKGFLVLDLPYDSGEMQFTKLP